jgi:hypothetical protein
LAAARRVRWFFLTDTQWYEEQAQLLLQAVCEEARWAGSRRVDRDAVALSIGINPPVRNLTEEAREFRNIGRVLKVAGYIDAPVNFEWVVLKDKGVRFCEGG